MQPCVNGFGVQVEDTRICVVMVGLPARGKSLIAQKGEIYLDREVSVDGDSTDFTMPG
jgi:6-phosphofructo-2-kinase/fructose-2,6-biphosphatase 2